MNLTIESYNKYKDIIDIYMNNCHKNDKIIIVDNKFYIKLNNCNNLVYYDYNSKSIKLIVSNIEYLIEVLEKNNDINDIIMGNFLNTNPMNMNMYVNYQAIINILIGYQLKKLSNK